MSRLSRNHYKAPVDADQCQNSCFHVHCVCSGIGFPKGYASTKRIVAIGNALTSVGIPFHVWHIGSSSYADNVEMRGKENDVTWEYLTTSIRRPSNKMIRYLLFLYGCLCLPGKLIKIRHKICIYIYSAGDLIDFFVLAVCRVVRIPVVQECCEWWPGTSNGTWFVRWMYKRIMFRLSAGALPISELIEKRIMSIAKSDYPMLRLPVLVDAKDVFEEKVHFPGTPLSDRPYLFWCGELNEYKRDVLFLVRVLGAVMRKHPGLCMILAGPCGCSLKEEVLLETNKVGLEIDQIVISGSVSETELYRLVTHARVCLLPLWNDDRSMTRFPTKLGLYAAAGCPIVTSSIGEVSYFIENGKTGLFAEPGDEEDWADVIISLLNNSVLYSTISGNIAHDLLPRFDSLNYGKALRELFEGVFMKSMK